MFELPLILVSVEAASRILAWTPLVELPKLEAAHGDPVAGTARSRVRSSECPVKCGPAAVKDRVDDQTRLERPEARISLVRCNAGMRRTLTD
ncbi:MAG: hypothetical protein R3178_09755, partial [Rhodothermales bacterium]|nr:hypothetical protein [Rhodothermales bacterium]